MIVPVSDEKLIPALNSLRLSAAYGKVTPVEVKAEENLRAKSLHQVVSNDPSLHGLRFSMSDYRQEDWLDNVPLYGVESYFG